MPRTSTWSESATARRASWPVPIGAESAASQCEIMEKMVPVEGLEPPTFGLQNHCSTS